MRNDPGHSPHLGLFVYPFAAKPGKPADLELIPEQTVGHAAQQTKTAHLIIRQDEAAPIEARQEFAEFAEGEKRECRRGNVERGIGDQALPQSVDHPIVAAVLDELHEGRASSLLPGCVKGWLSLLALINDSGAKNESIKLTRHPSPTQSRRLLPYLSRLFRFRFSPSSYIQLSNDLSSRRATVWTSTKGVAW